MIEKSIQDLKCEGAAKALFYTYGDIAFLRLRHDNWLRNFGESWESVADCAELEMLHTAKQLEQGES